MPRMFKTFVISDSNSVKVESFDASNKKDHGHFNDRDEAVRAIKQDPDFKPEQDIIVVVVK